jgi:hypothetical protein
MLDKVRLLLPLLLAQFAGQEFTFAQTEVVAFLNQENTRVNAGLSSTQITAIASGLVQLGQSEQSALLTKLTTPAATSAATK